MTTDNVTFTAAGFEPLHTGLSADQADGTACVTCARPLPDGPARLDVGRSAETGSVAFACPGVCADLATTSPTQPIPLALTSRGATPEVND